MHRWADVLRHLERTSGIVRSLSHYTTMRNRLEQYVQDLIATYEKIKNLNDFDEQTICEILFVFIDCYRTLISIQLFSFRFAKILCSNLQ